MNFLDLTYFSAFDSKFGFRVEFEVLHGARPVRDSIYQVLASVCPPAFPYSGGKHKMIQAFTLTKVLWDSFPDYFMFDEDEVIIKNVPLDRSSCLIFDIKRYNFISESTMDFGFAVYPLISEF